MANIGQETPLSIRSTRIMGAVRTHSSKIENELQDAYNASTVGELFVALEKAVVSLRNTGAFRSVNITLAGTPDRDAAMTDVVVTIEEKGLFNLGLNALTSVNGEHTGDTSLKVINALGRCETIAFTGSVGTKASNTSQATLTQPKFMGYPLGFQAVVERRRANNCETSSHNEKNKHIGMNVSTEDQAHRVGWDLTFRDLVPLRDEKTPYAKLASREVLYDCSQPSLKNAFSYLFTQDTRDNRLSPRTGSLLKVKAESAGVLGGDVYFNSLLLTAQHNIPVGPSQIFGGLRGCTLALGVRVGGVMAFGADAKRAQEQDVTGVRLCDRFNTGGPFCFRGFPSSGIGPRAAPVAENKINPNGDTLGAEAVGVISARLDFPPPVAVLADFGLRTHVYANVGNLVPVQKISTEFMKTWRGAAGIGVAYNLNNAFRLELNYNLWHRNQDYDQIAPGWQWGLGVDFL